MCKVSISERPLSAAACDSLPPSYSSSCSFLFLFVFLFLFLFFFARSQAQVAGRRRRIAIFLQPSSSFFLTLWLVACDPSSSSSFRLQLFILSSLRSFADPDPTSDFLAFGEREPASAMAMAAVGDVDHTRGTRPGPQASQRRRRWRSMQHEA